MVVAPGFIDTHSHSDLKVLADPALPMKVRQGITLEVLGPEVILVCELGGKGGPEIMVRCPRDFTAKPGQALTLHYDLSQIHVFDKATTKALPRPSLS